LVEISDETIIAKIHYNYRLMFLRDSVIASFIDESLNGIIQ